MKTTEQPMVQSGDVFLMSKPRRQDDSFGVTKAPGSSSSLGSIPIEWLDADCWRLPSGKALAEFALQAGFLAPLMLGMPKGRGLAVKKSLADYRGAPSESGATPLEQGRGENRKLMREPRGATKRV